VHSLQRQCNQPSPLECCFVHNKFQYVRHTFQNTEFDAVSEMFLVNSSDKHLSTAVTRFDRIREILLLAMFKPKNSR
jgi:hypothetical protein